ncbi:nuclear transport factor 2 family protein [Oscillatoria acuminata]|uniref:SnoaL-like domain-containing protein n=1 Tax=Oscillatoria acuminata PCC 6304 TaxID=56110 RepID=K9TME5_9CYAN|nr:nuclear transport factor 2 family protein [Oscillatoria acuminata]AFY83296.1 hypothetical protein Oscil6304_3736 [Oscillatoria acuminata PCC 6304]
MTNNSIPEWMLQLFSNVDSKNTDGFVQFFTPDGYFRFGNNAPATGQAEVFQAVTGFFEMIDGIQHDFRQAYKAGDAEILEGYVTYTKTGGQVLDPIPFCCVFEMRGEKIFGYRIYVDAAPLFAA